MWATAEERGTVCTIFLAFPGPIVLARLAHKFAQTNSASAGILSAECSLGCCQERMRKENESLIYPYFKKATWLVSRNEAVMKRLKSCAVLNNSKHQMKWPLDITFVDESLTSIWKRVGKKIVGVTRMNLDEVNQRQIGRQALVGFRWYIDLR